MHTMNLMITAWTVFKFRVFSGPYFHVFRLNTGKFGSEKALHLETFHAVDLWIASMIHSDIAILNINGAEYHCIISGISKSTAIKLLEKTILSEKS